VHSTGVAAPRLPLLVLLIALVSSVLVGVAGPATAASGDLYAALNASRQASGLVPLVRDPRLDSVAQTWTSKMVSTQVLGHNPNTTSQVPSGWTRVGENVGYAGTDARLHQAWMDSSGHRANILGAYTSVGIGWAKDSKGRVWATQVFATYPGTKPPAPAPVAGRFLLAATTPGPATADVSFGRTTDTPLVGDWNGDGVDTVGVRRGNVFHLRNSNSSGTADVSFAFGRSTDRVVVGDWDGDGIDTIGIRRGNLHVLLNTHGGNPAKSFAWGSSTDIPVVGDFDGNGRDTIGLRRGAQFILNDSLGGAPRAAFSFGSRTDAPLVGDWNGDGVDTVGVRRGSTYYLAEGAKATAGTAVVRYGVATDRAVIGDFDRDGADSLGVSR
jgi:hypothetical protein